MLDRTVAVVVQALSDSEQCSCAHRPGVVHRAGHTEDRDQSDKDGGASGHDDTRVAKCKVHGNVVASWISPSHTKR